MHETAPPASAGSCDPDEEAPGRPDCSFLHDPVEPKRAFDMFGSHASSTSMEDPRDAEVPGSLEL